MRARRQGHLAHAQEARRSELEPRRRPTPRRCPREAARRRARQRDRRRSRDNPVDATFLSRTRLNSRARRRTTLARRVRSLRRPVSTTSSATASASLPAMIPALVDELDRSRRSARAADFPIGGTHAARGADRRRFARPARRTCCSSSFLRRRRRAAAKAQGARPPAKTRTAMPRPLDVLAALEKFPGVRPDPEAFVEALDPLQPRLYSISSSLEGQSGAISLTVDTVRYAIGKPHARLGVASTFLAERVDAGRDVKVYVQKAHGFRPAGRSAARRSSWSAPAPASRRSAPSCRNAGDRRQGPQLAVLRPPAPRPRFPLRGRVRRHAQRRACCTRLSLAWSRDDAEKFYVQDRMREVGARALAWLDDGAHFYVCGDAKRMAKDVEDALVDIVAEHGGRRGGGDRLRGRAKKAGRYQRTCISFGRSPLAHAPSGGTSRSRT